MKFDFAAYNPPYATDLHLEFVKRLQPVCKRQAVLQPANWLIEEKGKNKKDREVLNIESTEIFNGNILMGMDLNGPISITVFSAEDSEFVEVVNRFTGESYKAHKYEICYFPRPDLFYSIKEKIQSWYGPSLKDHRVKDPVRDVLGAEGVVYAARVRGHKNNNGGSVSSPMYQPDWSTFFEKGFDSPEDFEDKFEDQGLLVDGKKADWHYWVFEERQNAENFINYLNGKFARFCGAMFKFSPHITQEILGNVPWLGFEEPVTIERLKEEFGLTEEELNYIDDVEPDWYQSNYVA